jgi:DNA-binding MarR family transcriptional regulator
VLSSDSTEGLQPIVNRVFRLHGALLRYGDRIGSRYGITGSQWQVLGVLRRGSSSVAGIARMIDLKRQSVQRTVDMLVEQRLVSMISNPANARSPLAALTVAGQRVATELAREQQLLLGRCAKRLDDAEIATVHRCLELLQSQLEPPQTGERPRRAGRTKAT